MIQAQFLASNPFVAGVCATKYCFLFSAARQPASNTLKGETADR
jgi:hypothetical protein